jgi:hypothetical protein
MTPYRLLWLAAACVGGASFLLFANELDLPCFLAWLACTIVCVITYKDAWSGR